MITRELAQELKDNGFPQEGLMSLFGTPSIPTLEVLFRETPVTHVYFTESGQCVVELWTMDGTVSASGAELDESLARLWLTLNPR